MPTTFKFNQFTFLLLIVEGLDVSVLNVPSNIYDRCGKSKYLESIERILMLGAT